MSHVIWLSVLLQMSSVHYFSFEKKKEKKREKKKTSPGKMLANNTHTLISPTGFTK